MSNGSLLPLPRFGVEPNKTAAEKADAVTDDLNDYVESLNYFVDFSGSWGGPETYPYSTEGALDILSAANDVAILTLAFVTAVDDYAGEWSTLSGAAEDISATHSGVLYQLVEPVDNVETYTPGVSAEWERLAPPLPDYYDPSITFLARNAVGEDRAATNAFFYLDIFALLANSFAISERLVLVVHWKTGALPDSPSRDFDIRLTLGGPLLQIFDWLNVATLLLGESVTYGRTEMTIDFVSASVLRVCVRHVVKISGRAEQQYLTVFNLNPATFNFAIDQTFAIGFRRSSTGASFTRSFVCAYMYKSIIPS
jgi:hypothetical protein